MNLSVKTITTGIICSLLISCATTPDPVESLATSMTAYERSLRWQNFDAVIAMHKNEHNKLTTEKRKFLKRFRITGYNEVYRKLETDGSTASQTVEVKYYNQEYGVVREVTLKNEWEYDKKQSRWYLTNPLPDFR